MKGKGKRRRHGRSFERLRSRAQSHNLNYELPRTGEKYRVERRRLNRLRIRLSHFALWKKHFLEGIAEGLAAPVVSGIRKGFLLFGGVLHLLVALLLLGVPRKYIQLPLYTCLIGLILIFFHVFWDRLISLCGWIDDEIRLILFVAQDRRLRIYFVSYFWRRLTYSAPTSQELSSEVCIFCFLPLGHVLPATAPKAFTNSLKRFWICPGCYMEYKPKFHWKSNANERDLPGGNKIDFK